MKLFNDDCMNVLREMESKSVDMILTDLPYGITGCKWDKKLNLDELFFELNRICKGSILLFSNQPFTTELIAANKKNFKYCWYWIKDNTTGGIFAKVQPMRKLEEICVFYDKLYCYNPQNLKRLEKDVISKPRNQNVYKGKKTPSVQKFTNYPNNILTFKNVPSSMRLHSTQKPVDLLEYLVRTYTNEGDIVMDATMGSGSTAIACLKSNRHFIGVELDADIYRCAEERVYEYSREKSLL